MKPIKEEITFEYLNKIDIRICEVVAVERVEDSTKLYKLTIDTGSEKKTVISALADRFTPEDLLDCCFPFVLNLVPRKIKGILSEAMILLSEDESTGKYYFLDGSKPGSVVL